MSGNLPAVELKRGLNDWYNKNLPALAQLWSVDDAKRMYLCAMNAISRNPMLLQCTRQSLTTCMIQAAEMRLFPGVLQECAFVPYKNNKTGQMEAQFIPQYQGLSKLALQSRLVTRIVADVVYEKDEFDYCQGSETYLKHKRALTGRGKAIAAYCYVDFADGGSKFELLSYEDVERVRTRSKARDSSYSPWTTDWDEMAKKTAIKRCLKTVPKSFELAKAIDKDNRVENDDIQTPEFEELPPGVTPADPEDKTEAMKEKVEAAKKAKEEAPGPAPRDVETKLEVHPSAQDEFEALKEKMAAKKEKKDGK